MTKPSPSTQPSEPALMPTASAVVRIPANHLMGTLLGPADEYLDVIEHAFAGTAVHVRGNEITADGPEAANVARLFEELLVVAEAGQRIDVGVVRRTIDMVRADEAPADVLTSTVLRRSVGGNVRPKTAGQKRYTDAIANNLVTFGIGPAGTGKSWLAVATAVQALQAKMVDRIVLTRPAVEAGSDWGFCPAT
nr:PhoH family protein [Candidatus Microthrix sp.]